MNNENINENIKSHKRRSGVTSFFNSTRKVSQGLETKKCFSCKTNIQLTNCMYCGRPVCIICIDDNACLVCHRSRHIVKLKKKKWYNYFCCF